MREYDLFRISSRDVIKLRKMNIPSVIDFKNVPKNPKNFSAEGLIVQQSRNIAKMFSKRNKFQDGLIDRRSISRLDCLLVNVA